jgi:hypothetical protein
MDAFILAFVAIGAAFGWLTFAQRHHFSEGSSRPSPDDGAWQRAGWVLTCSLLWPLMVVSGAFGWLLRRGLRRHDRG